MKRIIFAFIMSSISLQAFAQPAPGTPLDPTGKRYMKQRERTKFGGPVPSTLKMPTGNDNINITFVEIQIDPSTKSTYDISVRGTKTPKLRGCDNCAVAGRIILDKTLAKNFENISTDTTTKAKQEKNPAANRMVSFKTNDNKVYTVATTNEGGFMLTTLPNDTYSIWFGGKKVVTDFILTSVEVSEEELKKAQAPKLEEKKLEGAEEPKHE